MISDQQYRVDASKREAGIRSALEEKVQKEEMGAPLRDPHKSTPALAPVDAHQVIVLRCIRRHRRTLAPFALLFQPV